MLAIGQHYHKDGIEYEVKKFSINGFKLKITLINIQTKEETTLTPTITGFTTSYSKIPDSGFQVTNQ